MSKAKYQITETFPVLTPNLDVEALEFTGGMEFYENMGARFDGFGGHTLVSCHEFDEPWDTWEYHPKGDEIVILLTGSATMTWQKAGQSKVVELSAPGEYIIVPRGAWHTATKASNARMLFITPGEGTQNLETPPEP